MTRDGIESFLNPAIGLVVSWLGVHGLRALGLWDDAAWLVALIFFGLSWARSRALRWLFRRLEA